nr:dephospho-CoA kinase [uncultured Flavobacterium sp.]
MKTKVIGLTGGIGSGKTTVAHYFEKLGVPVYYADDEAKKILYTPGVVSLLRDAFEEGVFTDDVPDRAKISALVFADKEKLAVLNGIIHPKVKEHFEQWVASKSAHFFVIKEAAILFESGSHAQCDAVILVTAPLETRINRVMQRDGVSREKVLQRVDNQWTDEQKKPFSKYIITNINKEEAEVEVHRIFKILNKIEN